MRSRFMGMLEYVGIDFNTEMTVSDAVEPVMWTDINDTFRLILHPHIELSGFNIEPFRKLPPGAIVEMKSDDGPPRHFRIYRRDWKRQKLWMREVGRE